VSGFAEEFERSRPDIVLVLGDRYEVLAAAIAAALTGRIVAHLNGGEVTGGSLDEGWRHAITKIAHLHMPATREFAARIRAMGEDAWRIRVVGSPGVEAIRLAERLSIDELERLVGRKLASPVAICTYHPVTNAPGATERESDALIDALRRSGLGTVIFTAPNADAGGDQVRERIEEATRRDTRFVLVPSLGSAGYHTALGVADVMVGNSSSGLIEAPSFRLPSVNVGSRQDGRPRAANVIDVPGDSAKIGRALTRALSPRFRAGLRGLRNPYGEGRTSERVRDFLLTVPLDDRLRAKRFADR
jgi:UDP-hydrolysing UDP-N-acetyl-D-glucosamine 2-epimerase